MKHLLYYRKIRACIGLLIGLLMACQPDEPEAMRYTYPSPVYDTTNQNIEYSKIYYCPMHPSQMDRFPVKCPICRERMVFKPEDDIKR